MKCGRRNRRCVIEVAVFGTIAGATLAWAVAEQLRSRLLWTIGAALAVTHSAAAFAVFHGWSHRAAAAATARQTADVTGVSGWRHLFQLRFSHRVDRRRHLVVGVSPGI